MNFSKECTCTGVRVITSFHPSIFPDNCISVSRQAVTVFFLLFMKHGDTVTYLLFLPEILNYSTAVFIDRDGANPKLLGNLINYTWNIGWLEGSLCDSFLNLSPSTCKSALACKWAIKMILIETVLKMQLGRGMYSMLITWNFWWEDTKL